jgi:hypothetical protein
VVLVALVAISGIAEANRIPAFARKYRVSCALCHVAPPKLNSFGETFAANGFEFTPGEEPRDTIGTGDALLRLQSTLPLAIRYDTYIQALSRPSGGQVAVDFQTPWLIKLLSGGQVADKVSYYTYFLLTEQGEVEGLEDAYLQFTDIAGSGVSVVAGQFQISDPLFKRELRLEYEDYHAYRVRVGQARADLTYDRGFMALYSPWSGGDLAVELVSGRGLDPATVNRQYDTDDAKSTLVRFSQDIGPVRVGAFGYFGYEKDGGGVRNKTSMWGPDATIPLGGVGELNAQYVRRSDTDPFFGSCSVATPCPGNATAPFGTMVNSGLAEAILWPTGPTGRFFLVGLYNWVDSDQQVVSLRLGEQELDPPYLSEYRTASAGLQYLYRRNVRMLGEAQWDFVRDQARFVLGAMVAF